uniref:Uncharacterized protein n=1 Tax=Cacopsylla melanoneura TaxID=428564 RepID=A0A8D8Z8N2_9HEMI
MNFNLSPLFSSEQVYMKSYQKRSLFCHLELFVSFCFYVLLNVTRISELYVSQSLSYQTNSSCKLSLVIFFVTFKVLSKRKKHSQNNKYVRFSFLLSLYCTPSS